jgi:putative flippase GtrA
MSLTQYVRFLVSGAVVAVITIACRELIGSLLGADTALYYSVSVVLAYAIGIVLSFVINQRFTFQTTAASRDWSKFLVFVGIALAGMASTWALSLTLRYGLGLEAALGDISAGVAFALAALLSSALTYPLSALLVFRRR